MSDQHYCYPPDYTVLKNKFDLRDAVALERVERRFAVERATQGVPLGNFDLEHLCSIHHHLFQDIYEWAGQIRSVEISKAGNQFQLRRYILKGMADVHQRLEAINFLKGLGPEGFAAEAGKILGDINYVHPFRDGNGRAQALYLKQLASEAGHPIDLTRIDKAHWINASVAAYAGNYGIMSDCIRAAMQTPD